MTKTIGKYQVQGELGRGGFGTVYRAWDPTVNRAVAIKILTVQGDEDLLTRFRNEAAATGNLHHRNIVTIHDFGEQNGVPYMVMQLLEGQTLQDVMQKKLPLTLIQKLNIMGQVAEGLHHAHMHGIVHRDVKPPNIMILPDESVQIMDFGIARLAASTSRQTRTGFVIGTVLYMAPEQFLQNKVVDHRADIWAYGVIYYEFLTGKHPFAAPEETSVLYQVAHVEPAPLRTLAPDCPPALEEVIHRLLAKDPDFRYQSLKEVQFDVQPILVDLKRERAQEMVAQARQLAGDERLEEAQAAAQGILELDPSNREAHQLLQLVKQRLQRRLIQPRINALVQKAEQEVQARNFQPAIESFESAMKLGGADPAIEARLTQVRALLEQSRRAERLLLEAQREIRAQNFTAAFRIASEAHHADPGNTSASHLISQIQREIDMREAQRRLEEGVNRARGLLLLQQYDEAITALNELASKFPDDATVADLLGSARREKQQQERLERRRKEVSTIRDTLRQHRFESGIMTLEMLLVEFPGDPEINQLLGFAREEWESHRRGQAISKVRGEVEKLCADSRFDEAMLALEQALMEYPGDGSLQRLIQSVESSREEYEQQQRANAVRALLQQAGETERKGDSVGALRILEQGLNQYPDADALSSAATRLRQIVAQQERRDAIGRQTSAIEAALAAGEFPRAAALLEAARREFAGERVFDQLASKAAAARHSAELEMARARVRQEIEAGHQGLALELIGVALKRYPGDVQLSSMEREIRSAVAAAERQARLDQEARDAAARHEAEERRAREEADRQAREKAEAERRAREESERRAVEEARARAEAERKAREEVERAAAEARARAEAERKAREDAERRIAEERSRVERERLAREEAERRVREEADRAAAEQAARIEAERRAREEAERRVREQADRAAAEQAARIEGERRAREEAERRAAVQRAQLEAERKAREEAERKAREEGQQLAVEQQARLEREKKAREESERRAAEQKARLEAERKAREEAERRAKEESARLAAEQKAALEAERRAREESEKRAAEQRAQIDKERKAREQAEKREAEERVRLEKERKAREEAEKKARKAAAAVVTDASAMPPPGPSKNNMPLILGGAGAVILAIAGGVYMMGSGSKPTQPVTPTTTQSAPAPSQSAPEPAQTATTTTPPPQTQASKPEPSKPVPAPVKPTTTPYQDSRPAAGKSEPVQVAQRPVQTQTPAAPPPQVQPQTAPPAQQTPAPPAGRPVGDAGRGIGSQGPVIQKGPWMGKKNGKLAWSGQLPPGGRVVLSMQRVVDGPGEITSVDLLPGFTEVEITGVKGAGVTVVPNGPNSLTITNGGSAPVSFVEVSWRVKQ